MVILARSVNQISEVVMNYAQNRQNYSNLKNANYLDVAILLFCEALLMEFLSSFESTTSIRIKQKVYLLMIFGNDYNEEL